MVFVKKGKPNWTIREQLMLFKTYQSDSDWPSRSSKLSKEFSTDRAPGFFSPNNCQTEFDRLLSLPCPGHKVASPGKAGFSHKAVVDSWIKHLTEEITKEIEKQDELDLVEIRRKSALIERLWNDKPPSNDTEIDEMLAEVRKADEKRTDKAQVGQVVNAYMVRLQEVIQEAQKPLVAPSLLPPSTVSLTSPEGVKTAFRSPSPYQSPLKSPIRPVAEAIREALSPRKQSEPPQGVEAQPEVEPVVEQVAEETPEVPVEKTRTPSPVKSPVKRETPQVEKPEKRGRGRPSKVHAPAPETVEPKQEVLDEKPLKEKEEKKPKPSLEGEHIQIENSPAGRRVHPRGVVDSPLTARPGKRTKSQMGSNDDVSEQPDEKKRRRPGSSGGVKEPSVVSDVSTSVPSTTGEGVSVSIQTEISIRGALWTPVEKKEKERRQTPLRKSSRRSEVSDDSSVPDIGCQTGKVDFDKEDKIFIQWKVDESCFVPTVLIEEVGKVEADEVWSDEDDLALSSLSSVKKSSASEGGHEVSEKTSKKDSKKEITVIFETDESLANELLKLPRHSLLDDGSAASTNPKRSRQEEKLKEETSAHAKSLLLNAFRNISEHRHSGIFSHPVNDKEAPGYSTAVRRRMDLHTLKKEIETGVVTTTSQLKHKLLLMFANAVMFNSTSHDVNNFAKNMAKDAMDQLLRLTSDNTTRAPVLSHARRSKLPEELHRVRQSAGGAPSHPPRTTPSAEIHEVGKSRTIFGRKGRTTGVRKIAH